MPLSESRLSGLAQRLSAYGELRADGSHVYNGGRLVATFHQSLLGTQTMDDLQTLMCLAPKLLSDYLELCHRMKKLSK